MTTHHLAFRLSDAVAICGSADTDLSLDADKITCVDCRRICGLAPICVGCNEVHDDPTLCCNCGEHHPMPTVLNDDWGCDWDMLSGNVSRPRDPDTGDFFHPLDLDSDLYRWTSSHVGVFVRY